MGPPPPVGRGSGQRGAPPRMRSWCRARVFKHSPEPLLLKPYPLLLQGVIEPVERADPEGVADSVLGYVPDTQHAVEPDEYMCMEVFLSADGGFRCTFIYEIPAYAV